MNEISKHESASLEVVAQLEDPSRLRKMIENAREKGSAVVESAAFQRLCFVQPSAAPGTLEHDVWQSIHALEQMLLEERGKTVRLTRTRQKLRKTVKRRPSQTLLSAIHLQTGVMNWSNAVSSSCYLSRLCVAILPHLTNKYRLQQTGGSPSWASSLTLTYKRRTATWLT